MSAPSPIPQRTSHPSFLYTSDGAFTIDVIPVGATYSTPQLVGMLGVFDSIEVHKEGYWQKHTTGGQGEAINHRVKVHDPTYADAAALNFAGIFVQENPTNKAKFEDEYNHFVSQDRTVKPNTIAGSPDRNTILMNEHIVLARFWDTDLNALAQLQATDFKKKVFASKTDGAQTGKAGYASINQDGVTGIVCIGWLFAIPAINSEFGYIKYEPQRAV